MLSSLSGRSFLITGGTGSFGQTMAASLLDAGAEQVRIFSRDEAKQESMRRRLRDSRLRYYIGDVRDRRAIVKATRGVEYVFHAAALKQVPTCEFFPLEALRTNVLGSANVVDACERNGVATLILLSTDKAVYPVSAMGMTKSLMEKVAQAHARATPNAITRVACVRYGNVIYSRGSVIPLWVEQIANSQPLTVTEPAMTRFLMSLADSVQLVQHAFLHADPGDVFVRKASACTVGALVEALCTIFDVPAKLEMLGIRPGERMYETLASDMELAQSEDFGDFLRIRMESPDFNYALYAEEGKLGRDHHQGYTSSNAPRLSVTEVVSLLLTIPEIRAKVAESRDFAVI